jgi:YHS domain-containing protein
MSGDESRIVQDPICGKQVDTLRARAVGIFGGVTYYFCSAECKSKFKDPRQGSGPAPVVERRKPEPARGEPLAREEQKVDLQQLERDDAPVHYARSRIRRITGEVGTPVVQIDLNPNARPKAKPAPAPDADAPVDELPRTSSRLWVGLVVVMLIIAGGVILFTLGRR